MNQCKFIYIYKATVSVCSGADVSDIMIISQRNKLIKQSSSPEQSSLHLTSH